MRHKIKATEIFVNLVSQHLHLSFRASTRGFSLPLSPQSSRSVPTRADLSLQLGSHGPCADYNHELVIEIKFCLIFLDHVRVK